MQWGNNLFYEFETERGPSRTGPTSLPSSPYRVSCSSYTHTMANGEQPTGIIRPGKYWVGILCVCVYWRRCVRTLNLPGREVLLHYNVHNKCSILYCTIMNIIRVCDDYLFNNKPQARCRSVQAVKLYAIV